jgi:hypothetical protein
LPSVVAHDRVGEREEAVAGGDVQRGLLWARHADLQRAHAGCQFITERESLDVELGALELVQAGLVAADWAVVFGRVAQVVAVGQHDQPRRAGQFAVSG